MTTNIPPASPDDDLQPGPDDDEDTETDTEDDPDE